MESSASEYCTGKRDWGNEDNPQPDSKRQRNHPFCDQTEIQNVGRGKGSDALKSASDLTLMWVGKDKYGRPKLVSEHTLGTRDWRMGDPNMKTCYVCKLENNLFGCKTCMRSSHAICLVPPRRDSDVPSPFHCPVCVEKNWHTNPPTHIIPLSAASSPRKSEFSPKPSCPAASATSRYSATCERYTVSCESATTTSTTAVSSSRSADECMKNLCTSQESGLDAPYQHGPYQSATVQDAADHRRSDCSALSASGGAAPRRSRYQTVSNEVDDALSTIYRELEMGVELQSRMGDLQARVSLLEQELNIANGRVVLSRQEVAAKYMPEVKCLQNQLCMERQANARLAEENNRLKVQLEELSRTDRSRELEEWKRKLRDFMNGSA
ncbi:PHD domain-containing protein [Blastomyces dermatitidis ER-3]|uniref:PHD domain-containing protein n=2 Tax=Ajellomyces dermatitidis TaxID=5039 RepID=F2TR67_AJEDA|nr:PHD domain-containing protein [Blastomyces dermatitidis ER-3]EEQ89608.1 PHD domain-containing protein [Blastomyces dermatitidis ER-3]EGE85730.1 PHD domain-containing protein [Blastomyces dermatitidis ATCC 18188]